MQDVTTGKVASHHFSNEQSVIDTTVTKKLQEMYAMEFNEANSEERAISHEDEQFLDIMKHSVHKKTKWSLRTTTAAAES